MRIKSKEITYRTTIQQIFFEDDAELIVKYGSAEDQPFDVDIDLEWIPETPEWAKKLSKEEIMELVNE